MRKEIVYSLAAVAAFPVVASAAESGVNAQQLQVSGPGAKTMLLTPEAGVQIKAGKYQLAFTNLTAGYKVNFTIKKSNGTDFADYALKNGDKAVSSNIPLGGGGLGGPTQSEAFDLEDGIYTITLTTTAETGMEAAGACLQLVFDFQGACDALKAKMVSEVNVIKNFKNPKAQPDISKLNEWQGIIDSVGMVNYATELAKLETQAEQNAFTTAYYKANIAQEGVNLKGYDLYEKYNLNAIPQDVITAKIIELADAAKANEVAYMRAEAQELADAVKGLNDGALKNALGEDTLALKGTNGLIDQFNNGTKTSDEVWDAFDELEDAVEAALASHKIYVEDINPYYLRVDSALNADSALVDVALAKYVDLKKQADTTFLKIDTLLNKIKADIDTAYDHAALVAQKASLMERLEALWKKTITPSDPDPIIDEQGKIIAAMNFYLNLAKYMIHGDSVSTDPNKFDVLNADANNKLYAEGVALGTDKKFLSQNYQLTQYADILDKPALVGTFKQKEDYTDKVDAAVRGLKDEVVKVAKDVNKLAANANFNPSGELTSLNTKVNKVDEALKILDDQFGAYRVVLDSIDSLKLHLDTLTANLDKEYKTKLLKIGETDSTLAYTFTPSAIVKKDDNQLGIKRYKEFVLFSDSIRAQLDTLKEYHLAEQTEVVDNKRQVKADFKTNTASGFRNTINKLYTLMDPAAKKYVETQKEIDSLYFELKAIEDFAKENGMYTDKYPLTKKNGAKTDTVTFIGGYKTRIDSIMNNTRKATLDKIYAYDWDDEKVVSEDLGNGLRTLQNLLDSAFKSRGVAEPEFTAAKKDSVFNYYMNKINGTDTAQIRKCIDLLKENMKTDSAKIDSLAEVQAFEALKKSVREMCDSLKDMITRIAGPQIITDFNKLATEGADYTGSEIEDLLADDQKQVAEMLKAVADTLRKSGVGTDVLFMKIWDNPNDPNPWGRSYWEKAHNDRAAADKEYSKTLFDQLGEDSEKLIKLLETMDKIKEYIENAKAALAANEEAMTELTKKFNKFLDKVKEAKDLVATAQDGAAGSKDGECKEVYTTKAQDGTATDKLSDVKGWYDLKLGAIAAPTANNEPSGGTDSPVSGGTDSPVPVVIEPGTESPVPSGPDSPSLPEPNGSRAFAPAPVIVPVAANADVKYIPVILADAVAQTYPTGSIMESFKKIYEKAKAAMDKGELAGNTTFAEELAELETYLQETGIDSIKIKQKSLNTLQLLESFDKPIKESMANANERIQSEKDSDPSAYDHYADQIAKIMLGYQGKTPLIEGEEPNETWNRGEDKDLAADSVGLIDVIYNDYLVDQLTDKREAYLTDIVKVITDLDDVESRMIENRTGFGSDTMFAKQLAKDLKETLLPLAQAYDAEFGTGWELSVTNLQKELAAIDLDSIYQNGGFEQDSLVGSPLHRQELWDIKDEYDNILQIVGDEEYVAQVQKDKLDKAAIGAKAQEAREAYEAAVKLDKLYKTLKSHTLREALEKAKELSADYNEALKDYPAQINEAADAAVKHIDDFRNNEETKKSDYPRTSLDSDTAEFRRIINAVTELANAFKDATDAAVNKAAQDFVDAFNNALNDSSFMDPTKTPNYIHYSDSSKTAGTAFISFIAALKDKKQSLNDAFANLSKTIDAIGTLDAKIFELENYENSGKSYADVKEEKLADRAIEDLQAGFAKAAEMIRKGNTLYYGSAFVGDLDEDEVNADWEAAKEPIRGTWPLFLGEKEAVKPPLPKPIYVDPDLLGSRRAVVEDIDEENINPGLGWIINNTINAENHREKYDSIHAILQNFIGDQEVQQAVQKQVNYETMMGIAQDLQQQLDAAKEANKNYLAIEDMKHTGAYKQAQQDIDALKAAVEEAYEAEDQTVAYDNTDSTKISRLIKIASTLIGDTLTAGDTAVTIAKAKTLFGMEQAYLENMESKLWTLFNKAAANYWGRSSSTADATLKEIGKPYEEEIVSIFNDIDSISDVADADKKKATADKMLAQQSRVDAVIAALLGYADAAGEQMVDSTESELLTLLANVEAGLDDIDLSEYEGLTSSQKDNFDQKCESILGKIDRLKHDIGEAAEALVDPTQPDRGKGKELLLKEDQFKTKIAALAESVSDLVDEIITTNAQNDQQKVNDARATRIADDLEDALEALDEAFAKFEDLENDYTNRINLLKQRAAAVLSELTDGLTKDELDDLYEKADDIEDDIDALIETASDEDIMNLIEEVEDRANDIEIDKDEFLTSDYNRLTNTLNEIKNEIAQYQQSWFGPGRLVGGLKYRAQSNDYFSYESDPERYDNLKDSALVLNARIDALEQAIYELTGGTEPFTILGDITGDGKVSNADVLALTKAIANGDEDELDPEVADINSDGEIDIEDIAWLQYLVNEGELPSVEDEVEARGWFGNGKSLNVQTVSTENGVTRLAINLESDASYKAFQVDIKLNGIVKSATLASGENAGLFARTLDNGTYRAFTMPTDKSAVNSGTVLYLDVEGLNGEISGTAKFVKSNFGSDKFDLSGTTAIDKLKNAAAAAGQKVYNLGGRMMDGLKKGVNILRGEDGSAKKVIKK